MGLRLIQIIHKEIEELSAFLFIATFDDDFRIRLFQPFGHSAGGHSEFPRVFRATNNRQSMLAALLHCEGLLFV